MVQRYAKYPKTHEKQKKLRYFKKKCRKILVIQKKVVPLHSQLRNQPDEVAMILGYGVMVTLQILVLSFLVRIRVSQLHLSNGSS